MSDLTSNSSRSKYPWHQWTDGSVWEIYHGSDYTISTYNMQISLHGRAKTSKCKVTSRSIDDRIPDEAGIMHTRHGLRFQFYDPDTP